MLAETPEIEALTIRFPEGLQLEKSSSIGQLVPWETIT